MNPPLISTPPLSPPSEGVIDMVFTLFKNDPLEMMRYVTLGARVDSYLDRRRLSGWDNLDVEGFVREFGRTSEQAKQLYCMLFRVIPWLVGAGEMTQARADSIRGTITERCPEAGLAEV